MLAKAKNCCEHKQNLHKEEISLDEMCEEDDFILDVMIFVRGLNLNTKNR